MKRLLCLLIAASPAYSQVPPEPPRMHAVVTGVDLPPSYYGTTPAHVVVRVVEDDGERLTLYIPYHDPRVPHPRLVIPKPRQRCAYDIAPGFAEGLVGHKVWAKERQVSYMINADCKSQ